MRTFRRRPGVHALHGLKQIARAAAICAAGACAIFSCSSRSTDVERVQRARSALVTALPSMSSPRAEGICVPMGGGRLLVAGGYYASGVLSAAEAFDPSGPSWSAAPSMLAQRKAAGGVQLPDGRVLVTGGATLSSGLSTTEILDAKHSTWTPAASMLVARVYPILLGLKDGSVLAVGGQDFATGAAISVVERYQPALDRWDTLPAIPTSIAAPGLIELPDGRILATGSGQYELLDLKAMSWSSLTHASPVYRDNPGVLLLPTGKALIAGGTDTSGSSAIMLSTTELFDPTSGMTTPGPTLSNAQGQGWLLSLASGAIVAGGTSNGVDLITADGARAHAAGFFGAARMLPCVWNVPAGIAVAGGSDASGASSTAELFSVAADGQPCKEDTDCVSGKCGGGVCGATPTVDAGGAPSAVGAASKNLVHCEKDADCATGHCADGVCCNTACADKCHSCALPGSPGICTAEPIGVDLRAECGAALSCTGTCDGAGKCIGSLAGAQCAPSRCTTPTTGVAAATCVAAGARCPVASATTFDCSPYTCATALGACLRDCTSSADCAGGFTCDTGAGKCVAPSGAAKSGCAFQARPADHGAAFAAGLVLMCVAVRQRRRSRG